MSEREGSVSGSTVTERMIVELLRGQADARDALDVLQNELLRQVFNYYSEEYANELACPHCGEPIQVKL